MIEAKIQPTTEAQRTLRVATRKILAPAFPRKIYDTHYPQQEGTGTERAIELSQQGYGIILDMVHFGYSDPPQDAAATYFQEQEFLKKRVVVGVAKQHLKPWLVKIGAWHGVELMGFTTQSTIDHATKKGRDTSEMKLNEGMSEFVQRAGEYLDSGQMVMLAGQGGRREQLFPEPVDGKPGKVPGTISLLFMALEKAGVTKFALQPIGNSIVGELDYSKENVGRYNLGREYRVVRGLTYTHDEFVEATKGKPRRMIDEYITRMKANLVAETYANVFDEADLATWKTDPKHITRGAK